MFRDAIALGTLILGVLFCIGVLLFGVGIVVGLAYIIANGVSSM